MEISAKRRICEICNKTFANGKAMGGHMRSHYAKLPVPTTPNLTQIITFSSLTQIPPLNPTSSSSFSDYSSSARSKRRHQWFTTSESPLHSESVSSGSDALSVEEVAMCLVMLSMDKLSVEEARKLVEIQDEVGAHVRVVGEVVDSSDEKDESACPTREKTQNYRCETCEKVFKSYQALGGHRANHQKNKKMKISSFKQEEQNNFVTADDQEDDKFVLRSFECPFCNKVFGSGKALGGHKKVHFAYLEIPHSNGSSKSDDNNSSLGLTFPALEEDEGTRQKSLIRITESTQRVT